MRLLPRHLAIGLLSALTLAACGGGSGSSGSTASSTSTTSTSTTSTTTTATTAAAQPGSTSSGTLTAFGSVFVNGHEFNTNAAKVIDDDVSTSTAVTVTNTTAASASSGLDVGMTVDVKAAADSSSSAPHAAEIHIHPLARGYVDASDSTAGTLQVMGQTVSIGTSTLFKDERACVSASTSPCTAITAQSGILATNQSCAVSGSGYQNQGGGAFVPGLYVQVFGLLATSSSSSTPQASLVRIVDPGTTPLFKAEGSIDTVGTGTPPATFTIGNLTLTTSTACTGTSSCAYATGTVVAARGTTAPTTTCGASGITLAFTPATITARQSATLTSGATIEIEGIASNVVTTTTPATFTLDGVTIQVGTGLTTPATGDRVEVLGTVNADLSVTATSIRTEQSHAQQYTPFLIQDKLASAAVTGTSAPYDLVIMGQHVVLDAHTRFFDSTATRGSASTNPFNITTAASYLGALTTPTVVVVGYQDATVSPSVFHALGLEVVPASSNVEFGGVANTVVNGSTLTVDGVTVTVSSSTTVNGTGTPASILVGDMVLVTSGSETLTSGAVTGITATAIKDWRSHMMQPE